MKQIVIEDLNTDLISIQKVELCVILFILPKTIRLNLLVALKYFTLYIKLIGIIDGFLNSVIRDNSYYKSIIFCSLLVMKITYK